MWSENKFTNLEDQRLQGTASSLPHKHVSALMMSVKGVNQKLTLKYLLFLVTKKPEIQSWLPCEIDTSSFNTVREKEDHTENTHASQVWGSQVSLQIPPEQLKLPVSAKKWTLETMRQLPAFIVNSPVPQHSSQPTVSPPLSTAPARRVYLTSDSPIWLNVWKGGDSWASMTGQKWSPWRYIITAVNASTVLLTSIWLLPAIMIDKA